MMHRLALALTLLAAPASAMTFEVRDRAVWATGPIETGDAGKFATAIAHSKPTVVVLDSWGGQVFDADMMAANIRINKLAVVVVNRCVSACFLMFVAAACFLMFVAGEHRAVVGRALVGVHSVNVDGDESQSAMAATVYVARRVALLGATPTSITKMVTTPPQSISYLTDADLREMGVRFVAAP